LTRCLAGLFADQVTDVLAHRLSHFLLERSIGVGKRFSQVA
jgi:hypothetical protein